MSIIAFPPPAFPPRTRLGPSIDSRSRAAHPSLWRRGKLFAIRCVTLCPSRPPRRTAAFPSAPGGGVAQVGAGLLGEVEQTADCFGMLGGDVSGFGRIGLQI